MEGKEIWILTYKFKMVSKKSWIVHSQVFGSSSSLFARENELSNSLGKYYATIHLGVSTLKD
jgi:hypothetical protein